MQSSNGNEIRILALAGSFRKGSFNQALIQAARELAPGHVLIHDFETSEGCLSTTEAWRLRGIPRRCLL